MKTNTALLIVITFLILGGAIFAFNGNGDQEIVEQVTSTSSLASDRQIHDFGDIDIFSGKVTTEFALTNDGSDDIVVTEGTTSCGCTDGEIGGISFGMHEKMSGDFTILAGETKNLTVIYDPLAHGPSGTGKIDRQVFIKTNSTVTPELEVRVTANVTKDVS
jgi:hypothetical protein